MQANGLTDVGHDPQAIAMLCGALIPLVDDPLTALTVASKVFNVLHDAGMRIVPIEVIA